MKQRTADALDAAIDRLEDRMRAEEAYLTELDSKVGDADHGSNIRRGFTSVASKFEPDPGQPLEESVHEIGMVLVSETGGASGPLFGSSMMHASEKFESGLTRASAVEFAMAYLEKVKDRGGAEVGEATMVDALTPAVHAFKHAVEVDDASGLEALERAVEACERGVEFTKPIRATKGRASYLDWRSIGHQDPGATSTLFILQELRDTAVEYADQEGSE